MLIICFVNFCIKYDFLFVVLEEEMNDSVFGLYFFLIDVKLFVMIFKVLFYFILWNLLFFFINGFVKCWFELICVYENLFLI